MGRQIGFYFLPEDERRFLEFLSNNPKVALLSESSDSSEPKILNMDLFLMPKQVGNQVLIWNRDFQIAPSWIIKGARKIYDETSGVYHETGETYFRISSIDAPVIVYSRSVLQPGNKLMSGRIWAQMDSISGNEFIPKGAEFERWYNQIARWLRSFLTKCDSGHYLGPEALKLFREGKLQLGL